MVALDSAMGSPEKDPLVSKTGCPTLVVFPFGVPQGEPGTLKITLVYVAWMLAL